jgi:uncharacterized BrkB/YihY/UPF0761 family membrane protein
LKFSVSLSSLFERNHRRPDIRGVLLLLVLLLLVLLLLVLLLLALLLLALLLLALLMFCEKSKDTKCGL